MCANLRYAGASVVALFPDRRKNGEPANRHRFSRESVLDDCRRIQLKAEACGRLSVAVRMVRMQAVAGCARLGVLRDLRRLELKAEACGQWSAAFAAIDLQRRFGGRGEKVAAFDAPRLAA